MLEVITKYAEDKPLLNKNDNTQEVKLNILIKRKQTYNHSLNEYIPNCYRNPHVLHEIIKFQQA